MKYSYKYFKNGLPEWKRRKDPLIAQIFYRRVSFAIAAICANLGIGANAVSYFSAFIAIIACSLFVVNNSTANLWGAILVNIWLILDCVDGNLARSYKKQIFGEFADGISSYILVALMCTAISIPVYFNGGIFIQAGNPFIIVLGALASTSDTLMRLIYQKYKMSEYELIEQGRLPPKPPKDNASPREKFSLVKRIEEELGVGGILPLILLVATLYNALDIVVLYCVCFYGAMCIVSTLIHIRKAIRTTKKYDSV